MHAEDTGEGRAGRARAARHHVLAMAHTVLEDTPERIVVRRWLCGTIATWRRIGQGREQMFELADESAPAGSR